MIPPKLLRTLAFSLLAFFFTVAMGVSTSYAQNTIYVDATNGSNLNSGTSAQPVATIEKGLDLLEDGGTLVVKGSTYNGTDGTNNGAYTINSNSNSANDLESFTLRLESGVASVIDLQSTALTVDLDGTLTVTSVGGAYLMQQSTTLTLTDGNVNIDASSSWRLANNTTLTLANDAAFTGSAPQKGTNLNLVYNGATVTSKTAGPEASYGNYGSGNITVNLSNAAASLSLPAAITTTGAFNKTNGDVSLSGSLTAGTFTNTADDFTATGTLTTTGANTHTAGDVEVGGLTVSSDYSVTADDLTVSGNVDLKANGADLVNGGSGNISVTGNVTGRIITGGTADANISSIENAGTGSTTVSGTVTLTADNNYAGGSFAGNAALYANDGNLTTGNFTITTASPSAGNNVGINVIFLNDDDGALTVGNVTATEVTATGPNSHIYNIDVTNSSTGSVTVGTGIYEDLANNSTGSMTVGSATISGNVSNNAGGTVTLAGGTVAGTLSNNNANSAMDINGNLTVSGAVTNAGTGTGDGIDIGANTLTLDGAVAHATNGGVFTGSGEIVVTETSSFDGGTLVDLEVNGSGKTVTLQTNAVTAGDVEVSDGSLAVNIGTTVDSITMSGGNATVGAVTLTTDDYTQSSGTVTLNNGATLDVNDAFTRSAGTFTANATSTLSFTGTAAQDVNVGDNFQANNVTFNNTAGTITLNRSIRANGDATIAASTTVDFKGFNLIMNGATSDFTLTGSYQNTTNGGVYFGGVDAGGTIVVQGGSAAAGQNFSGTGTFGNIFVAVGAANTLTFDDATSNAAFTNNLTLVSGTLDINGGANTDLSPVGTEAQVVVYPEGSNGITATNGTFNGDNVNYDLTYEGSISGNQTISNEFTANVVDVTISTTTNNMVFADQNYTINGDLTVESGATLQTAATAARTVTIKGELDVAGTVVDGASGAATTFVLEADNENHSVTGAFTDASSELIVEVQGDGVTIAGSGTSTANKNIIDAVVNVTGNSATISGIQELQQDVTLNAATATALSLSLIDPDQNGAATVGLIGGNLTVDGAGAGAATLTLGSNVEVTGTTNVGATGTVALGSNDLDINGTLTANSAATFTTSGGYVDAVAALTVNANGTDIPNLRSSSQITLGSALEVSGNLDADADVIGAQALELSGNAALNANIANNVTLTGTAGAVTVNAANRTLTGNLVVNTTGTVSINNDGSQRTIDVAGNYTNTAGTLNLTANTLDVSGNVTLTAGTPAMTTGRLRIDATGGNRTLDLNNRSVTMTRLEIDAGANDVDMTASDEITISDLYLTSGDFDAAANGDVIIADGGTINRAFNANTALLSDTPAFGSTVNLSYTGAGTIATANEQPSSDIVSNVTVNLTGGNDLDVTKDLTINGTLTLTAGAVDESGAGVDLAIASGGTVVVNAGTISDAMAATTYNLTYKTDADGSGGSAADARTAANEWTGTPSVTIDNDDDDDVLTVTINSNRTLTGLNVTQDDVLSSGTFNINLTGDLTIGNSSAISGTGALVLNGSTEQTLNLPSSGLSLPNNMDVTLDNSAGANLASGNLVITSGGELNLTDGIFKTGTSNYIQLDHSATADQGFSRTDGHVFGNVRKQLPSTGTASNRVEFPVGGNNVDGVGGGTENEYSPMAVTFDTPQNLPSGIFMTVGHVESNPGGLNGFPIADGVEAGEDIVRYPDEFYWTVKTSTSLPATEVYDIEMERNGYSEYTQTGAIADVEDMRIIRRAAGNQDNDWLLQGDNDDYAQNYQTGTFPNTFPTIIGTNIQGGLIAGNGSVFTYGLKSNLEVNEPNALTLNVGQTRDLALVADTVFTGGTGDYTYTISGNDAAVATAVISNNVMTFTAVGEGSTVFTVKATDELGDSNTAEIGVNVNADLVASTIDDQIANVGDTVTVDLSTVFTPGSSPITYSASSDDAAVATAAIVNTSTLEVVATGAGSADITVLAVDAANDSASVTFTHTVGGAFAASGTIADQSLRAGDTSNQDAETFVIADLGTYYTGGSATFTYAASTSDAAVASATVEGDSLTVTALSSSANTSSATVTIVATDGTGATASQSFDVTTSPAYGDVVVDGVVNTTDAQTILNASIEATTLTATQESVADVNQDSNINSFDASVTFRYFLEVSGYTTLPFSSSAKVADAELTYGDVTTEESMVTIPLNVEGSEIYSVDFIGNFDANSATVESIDLSDLPEDWMVVKSTTEEGKVAFALAGVTPITSREIAKVSLKLDDAANGAEFSARGYVNTFSYALDEIAVKELPQSFALDQNYPNPFNPVTNVSYQLPAASDVTIELWSVTGQKVMTLVNERKEAGSHTIQMNGANLSSGVYIYRIHAQSAEKTFTFTRKMTLIK